MNDGRLRQTTATDDRRKTTNNKRRTTCNYDGQRGAVPWVEAALCSDFLARFGTGGWDHKPTTYPTKYLCQFIGKNIYVSICAHAYLQMGQCQKKTQKIGRKHRTPSEKEKNRNAKSVPTRIRFSLTRSKKSQPNRSVNFVHQN